jgi:phage baseplate assembly protein gpV
VQFFFLFLFNKPLKLLIMSQIYTSITLFFWMGFLAAQTVPELIYYKFDNGASIVNDASAPVGSNPASITGTGLSVGGTGLSGTALIGAGVTSTGGRISTNWPTTINGSFTIGFWTSNITPSSTLWYIFGDASALNFRCFTNGVAGANNWMMRFTNGLPDITATGAATGLPTYTHFVYDAAAGQLRSYVNGVLNNTVVAPTTFSVTGVDFQIGGAGSFNNLSGNLDEFRFYNRALTPAEIAATYNITLGGCGKPDILTTAVGCDEVTVSWTSDTSVVGSSLEYGAPGFAPGTGIVVAATSNPFTLTGLAPGVSYDMYLRDTCGGGVSPVSDTIKVTTNPLPSPMFTDSLIGYTLTDASFFFDASPTTNAHSYTWWFGDGSTDTGITVTHAYTVDSNYTITLIATGDCGSDTLRRAVAVRGISAPFWLPEDIRIFPNPVVSQLQISGSLRQLSNASVAIYESGGRLVHAGTVPGIGLTLDLSHLPPGTYFLELRTEEAVHRQKLIKVNP